MEKTEIRDCLDKYVEGDYVEEATKYVIDSVQSDNLRFLISTLKEKVKKEIGVEGLAKFDVWSDEEEKIVTKREASEILNVSFSELLERKVFVRIGRHTIDITGQVRDESKKVYRKLLFRESKIPTFQRSREESN